jgi:hypothetical protein
VDCRAEAPGERFECTGHARTLPDVASAD